MTLLFGVNDKNSRMFEDKISDVHVALALSSVVENILPSKNGAICVVIHCAKQICVCLDTKQDRKARERSHT